jgi:hypothetical protein
MKYLIIVLLLLLPFQSMAKYTGKRFNNLVDIIGTPTQKQRDLINDYATRYKSKTPIQIYVGDSLPDTFIANIPQNEKDWLKKNKDKVNGLYDEKKRRIYVKSTDDYLFLNNFGHELGHHFEVDYNIRKEKDFFSVSLNDNISISGELTGHKNQKHENVANNFSLYLQDPDRYEKENEKEYDYFEKTLKGIGTVRPQSLFVNNQNNNMPKKITDVIKITPEFLKEHGGQQLQLIGTSEIYKVGKSGLELQTPPVRGKIEAVSLKGGLKPVGTRGPIKTADTFRYFKDEAKPEKFRKGYVPTEVPTEFQDEFARRKAAGESAKDILRGRAKTTTPTGKINKDIQNLIDSNSKMSDTDVKNLFNYFYGREPNARELDYWGGKKKTSGDLGEKLEKNAGQFKDTKYSKDIASKETVEITKKVSKPEEITIEQNRVQDLFKQYGYEATDADINYWSDPNKKNEFGTLEENLKRRQGREGGAGEPERGVSEPARDADVEFDPFEEALKYGYTREDFAADKGFYDYWKNKTPEQLLKGLEARGDWDEASGKKSKVEPTSDEKTTTEEDKLTPEQKADIEAGHAWIDEQLASGQIGEAQAAILHEIFAGDYVSGQKIPTEEELSEIIENAAKNAEADLSPYYEKLETRDVEDVRQQFADIREDVAEYGKQEAIGYKQKLQDTKQSLRQRGMTFAGEGREKLGAEGIIRGAGVEGVIPEARRAQWEGVTTDVERRARDAAIAAERKWGTDILTDRAKERNLVGAFGDIETPYGRKSLAPSADITGGVREIGDKPLERKAEIEKSKWERVSKYRRY